ncbi:hypothetical protein [Microbacterium sp. MYb66]|jgi:hypothetical protein|uniref:hypothetical protein n=1 Tax=Microbacterium sp. MYb66 TaxID=1848692 RepID=UPI0015E27E56|nr:hypothetical protein [Microbacterium sp. MYb66]
MYEHPYLSRQITVFEQEQMERAAAQRRFLVEHADQIVPRPEGALRRMLRRVVGAPADPASTARTASVCDSTAVPAR